MDPHELDARIHYAAKAIDSVRHVLAGPLQSAVNAFFVLDRKLKSRGVQEDQSLTLAREQLTVLLEMLETLSALPRSYLPLQRDRIDLEAIAAQAQGRLPAPLRERIDRVLLPESNADTFVDGEKTSAALGEILRDALRESTPHERVTWTMSSTPHALVIHITQGAGRAWPQPLEPAVDPLVSAQGKSLVLGLPMAYVVASIHGGHLKVLPEFGGKTLELLLPTGDA